jgi:hypothetical protein
VAFGSTGIEIRADAGFAVPALHEYREEEGIHYTVGPITNPRLKTLAGPLLEQAPERYEAKGKRSGSWPKAATGPAVGSASGGWRTKRRRWRRARTPALRRGQQDREEPEKPYEWYVQRGETENRIKDFEPALKADRLGCCRFLAEQFRLLLHAAAHRLTGVLRNKLVARGVERMRLDTLALEAREDDRRQRTPTAYQGTPPSRVRPPRPAAKANPQRGMVHV